MRKIFLPVLILIAASSFMVACKSGANSSDPKSVLKAFFEKLAAKDIEGAAKYATADSKQALDMIKKSLDMAEKFKDEKGNTEEEDFAKDFKDVEFGDAKIDGDNATVPVTNKKEGKTVNFPLKKENGGWKVNFNMQSLMEMGKEAGDLDDNDFNMDTLNNQLNKIDPEELKKGMEQAEEMLKKMDPKQLEELKKAAEKVAQ